MSNKIPLDFLIQTISCLFLYVYLEFQNIFQLFLFFVYLILVFKFEI